MQRVAIARALVNDPDILLADEPTGALDSETSVQVMDILREIAEEKLVIMVTHNPELADTYATRIVRLKDGSIVDDTNPFDGQQEKPAAMDLRQKKPGMSFFTAFSLSLNNLMTKKGRTILTSFAGSIGIIGIALILSLSTGINTYINQIQEDTLSSYPITIEAETVDMNAMMVSMMGAEQQENDDTREEGRVYSSTVMYDMLDSMMSLETSTNNLKAFKEYLDNGGGGINDLATIQYGYAVPFDVYTKDEEGTIVKSDLQALIEDAFSTMTGGGTNPMLANNSMASMAGTLNVWEELLLGKDGQLISDSVKEQYDLLHGKWPESYDEVILFVDQNNEISDLMLVSLGLVPSSELDETLTALTNQEGEIHAAEKSWSYEELCALEYQLILPAETYRYDEATGTYVDMSATEAGMELLYNSEELGTKLKVVGIARPSEEATSTMVTGVIGYTNALSVYAIETTEAQDVVKDQLADETTDVFTDLPFRTDDYVEPTAGEKATAITDYLLGLPAADKAAAYVDVMSQASDEYVDSVVAQQMTGMTRESIEELIVQQYAAEMGVDADTIAGYIADTSDEELFAQIGDAMAASVREQYAAGVQQQMNAMSQDQLATAMDAILSQDAQIMAYAHLAPFSEAQYVYLYDNYMPATVSEGTCEDNLDRLGYVDLARPATISIYASTFAEKDEIADRIQDYNDSVTNEDDAITYTDYVALLMSSITGIISGISYLLIAFVSISLVVSSIMIGVITLISVQERTKEIGILRAVGASKRDVSRVFNAETMIVGLGAGLVGIGMTLLLIIPINAILLHFTGLEGLKATLPMTGGVILVVISALLTLVAGLIPSRVAAKKDPVVALRTE